MLTQDQLTSLIQKGLDGIVYPGTAPRLCDPVRYTLETGGKRLRPMLVLMAANLFKEDVSAAITPAIGLEMYHNCTLLHDDVMDRASDRRGRPTVHVKWNDSVAILSGDAMQTLAYQLITTAPDYCLRSVLSLFNTTNMEVWEGQQLDMEFETRNDVSEEEYIEMIRLKTSVLLGCALKLGALVGEATEQQAQILYDFGQNIGLAFQLQDDWLDCWGDPKTFGKRIGGDILCNKKTFLRITAEKAAPLPDTSAMTDEEKIEAIKDHYVKTGAEKLCREAIAKYHSIGMDCLSRLNMSDDKLALLKSLASKLENRNK
ncbi:MAG: polyprenyl synthetase family protein [Bacteroidales bacterium]|nr:polyprenyl synthetase family protein [Candidatus Liminaster caballi]